MTKTEKKIKTNCSASLDEKRFALLEHDMRVRKQAISDAIEALRLEMRYDPWAYGFNVDMTAGYNEAIRGLDDKITDLKRKEGIE